METNKKFLLTNPTAEKLYYEFAEPCPILDYHCHIAPKEIADNIPYENIAQMWLYHDHYKWRLMRSNGVDEYYITGKASDKEKFQKYAETLEAAVGNPLYHWSHLELQKYFDYHGTLNGKYAEEVWNHCNAAIKEKKLDAHSIIRSSNVTCICTTDDPADDLKDHDRIAQDQTFDVSVFPAWRPDKIINIEAPVFEEYLEKLGEVSGTEIDDFDSLQAVIRKRMDYFEKRGCRISDHGLTHIDHVAASQKEVSQIFTKRREGFGLTATEISKYKTAVMLFLGREYSKRNWVMQLHFGAKRDNNKKMYDLLGADTGFDCIGRNVDLADLADFLNELCVSNELPKTVLYSLNPNDNAVIGTMIGCFQGDGIKGKMQHGSAWWFNDHKTGMEHQLISLATQGLLGNFIGMTTDSRSILSYTRHEYFRRVLCNLLGRWVEAGEYPNDREALGRIVRGISYQNGMKYFGFLK